MDGSTKGSSGVSAVVEYDYTAKEPDELDLVKGDLIHNIKQMPGGWWEGTLQPSGKIGMFPDNFVRVVDMNEEHGVVLRDKSTTANRRCKVIYSYTQVNEDELSLGVGDVIEFLGEVEEGWWRGRLKTKIGVFPSNFVVAIEQSPIFASKRPPTIGISNTAAATYAAKMTAPPSASSSNNSANTAANTANAAVNNISTSTTATSNKKQNRSSFHSSKEDLLSSTATTTPAVTTNTGKTIASTSAGGTAVDDIAPSLPPKPQRDFCRVEFPYAPLNEDELELKFGDIITIISMELPDKGWWKGELRGKVGVFPDNFVKLLAPTEVSPLNDTQFSNKTTKNSATIATSNLATSASSSVITTVKSSNHASSTSKVFIKKSGSTSATTQSAQGQQNSSGRKDSFGSRDSLNDILSETGLQSGNVAAQRKSLENKNLDLLNAPDAGSRLVAKKQQQETATVATSTSTTIISSSSDSSSMSTTSDMRKSLENIDEKTKTPPPVLTKKPLLGAKGILSGLKQKVKNVDKPLTSAVSHDYADGIGSSKMSGSAGLPESGVSGNVVMRRAATIAVEDTDFDSVERGSILPDVRAGRVKAPRRRPPSAAYNVLGESNNNNSVYLNGSGGSSEVIEETRPQSSDDNSTGDELLAKPKPREWQTQKAPWMAELKATQVKKKTSPNVEPRSAIGSSVTSSSSSSNTTVAAERTKTITEDAKITNSSGGGSSSSSSISALRSSVISSSTSSAATSTKVQSSSISSTILQQSMSSEQQSAQQLLKKDNFSDAMTRSMFATDTSEDVRTRPSSLSLRNRSISPSSVGRTAAVAAKSTANSTSATNAAVEAASNSSSSNSNTTLTAAAKTTNINNHSTHTSTNTSSLAATTIHENNIPALGKQSSSNSSANSNSNSYNNAAVKADGSRVIELEKRVEKLETLVQSQQRTIDELVRTLREETDRVKVLRGELDKYAQCVTQV